MEGALTGAFPAAAVAISAAAGATEAIVTGAIKGTSARDVAIDAVVSGRIGALTGAMGMGAGNNNEDLYDSAAKAAKKLYGEKLSPTAKKAAKNEIKKAAKAVYKEYKTAQVESLAYGGLNKFTTFYFQKYAIWCFDR